MSSKNKDAILRNFISITQCPNEQAREYLESTDWHEETAVTLYFDSLGTSIPDPIPSKNTKSTERKTQTNVPKKSEPDQAQAYDSDDDFLQTAIEDSLRLKPPEKSPVVVPKRVDNNKSIISSKINTVDTFRKNKDDSDDEEGQAFYAGGSEQSGQQIIGPPKNRNNDKKVEQLFDAARKQGATEAQDNDAARKKNEKPFAGAGYSLGDKNMPSQTHGQPTSGAAAANAAEQIPIRLYSNGFSVGDGELRKFEDNREFMEYIKRGEIPPELRNTNPNGRQIEVRLEDHRGEEYKRVTPAFKPFGGTGHTIGLPPGSGQAQSKSSVISPVHTETGPPDASRLEQLAEKRLKTSSSSSTTIRLRLPDISTPISIKIDLNRTLGDVRRFLNENVPSLQSNTFEFMEPPSTKIKREDERRKIGDAHLANSTLAVRRTA
jgi:UBX domain-containing protein 1